jgi:alkylated DNA repair dioxygenase AlkB
MDFVKHHKNIIDTTGFYETLKEIIPWKTTSFNGAKSKRNSFGLNESNTLVCPVVGQIANFIQLNFKVKVRGCFMNHYEDGNMYVPYHADRYPFDLFTVSIGATRDFYFKHNITGKRHHFKLEDGDVISFKQQVNHNYKHSIPIRKRVKEGRISILFFVEN